MKDKIQSFILSWSGARKWTVHVLGMLLLAAGHFWGRVDGNDFAMYTAALAASFTVGNASEHLAQR